jgi:hypothetical protein
MGVYNVDQGARGGAYLTVRPVPVVVDEVKATPQTPNTAIQFSDTITVSARVTTQSSCCGPASGTVTFMIGPTGVAAPIGFPAGVTSQVVTASFPLTSGTLPSGGSYYTLYASFHSSNPNYADSTGYSAVTVEREAATVSYTGGYWFADTAKPAFAITIDQRDPASDADFIDYRTAPTWIRIDLFTPGASSPSITRFAQVANSADWSSTGLARAQATLATPLTDGVYEVVIGFVRSDVYSDPDSSPYLSAELLRFYIASAPGTSAFGAGAGYISPDSSSNVGARNGYFGFFMKSGKPPQIVAYAYRISMDVGGYVRDVDVEVTGTSVSSMTLKSSSQGGSLASGGSFSVRYLDALTGVDYVQFDFAGGIYQLYATDGASGDDTYALTLRRADATVFHTSSAVVDRSPIGSFASNAPLGGPISVRSRANVAFSRVIWT